MTRPWLMFAASLALSAPLSAQDKCGPDEQVPWWPMGEHSFGGTTAAQRAAMRPALNAAQALVRKTVYGTPRGYAMYPVFGYGGEVVDATRLHEYLFGIIPYWACNKYEENGSYFTIFFNPDPMKWSESDRPLPDERGDGLYMQRIKSAPLFGSTATFGHFQEENTEGLYVLFTSGGESPTLAVTQEEYLQALIFTFEGKNQVKLKEAIAATRQMYANDSLGRDKTLAGLTAHGDRMRARIAAMTPAERAAPAWVGGTDIVPAGTIGARAAVRRNPAFYRARTSPFEVRAILVHIPGAMPQLRAYHEQVYKEFDWEGLKRLLAQ